MLSRSEINQFLQEWFSAWNRHDLEAVLTPMAETVIFEHWDGKALIGKENLRRAWVRWFAKDKDFQFEWLNMIIDESAQALSFEWRLHWMSSERNHAGQPEVRDGIDVIQLRDGQIVRKRTYIKTALQINDIRVCLRS